MLPLCQKWTSLPHIPVDLMATWTSPSARPVPVLTSSSEGPVSAIHRSWLGLVKTPMFGFVSEEVPFVVAASAEPVPSDILRSVSVRVAINDMVGRACVWKTINGSITTGHQMGRTIDICAAYLLGISNLVRKPGVFPAEVTLPLD